MTSRSGSASSGACFSQVDPFFQRVFAELIEEVRVALASHGQADGAYGSEAHHVQTKWY